MSRVEALYRAHAKAVRAELRRLGVGAASLDDLVQEIFLIVYRRHGEIPANPTWRDVEGITGNLVGTFAVPTGASAQWPQRIVINSFQCQETMRFRLSVNDWSLGYVSFNENTNSGLRISHNC